MQHLNTTLQSRPRVHNRLPSHPLLTTLAILFFASTSANAQWQIQQSHTTASLRGIHALSGKLAWASGTEGTILRTTDGGATWQHCTTPPDAAKLDFRGIQAFDENTAIVMSSGKGGLSRLYKTTDACQTWRLLLTNPDKEGFWDGLAMVDNSQGVVVGDPVLGDMRDPIQAEDMIFRIRVTLNGGKTWIPVTNPRQSPSVGTGLFSKPGETLFAASNSSLQVAHDHIFIVTSDARLLEKSLTARDLLPAGCANQFDPLSFSCGIPWTDWESHTIPIKHGNSSSGVFSVGVAQSGAAVAVGGNYEKPGDVEGTAAYTKSTKNQPWLAAQTPPQGYRSAVAYNATFKTWITVGPNGTDISTDDGENWRALKPSPTEPADADQNWNALSLPFVVGPKGRIGKLNPTALKPVKP